MENKLETEKGDGEDSHPREIQDPALRGKGPAEVRALCEGTHPELRCKNVAEVVKQIQIQIQIQMFCVDQLAMQR